MTGDPDHSTGTATIAIAVEADDWGGALPDCEALIEAAARAALAGTCPELPANTKTFGFTCLHSLVSLAPHTPCASWNNKAGLA